jgi:hypothetical protein
MRFQQSEVQTLKPKIESKAIEEIQRLKQLHHIEELQTLKQLHREGGTSGVKP